MINLLNETFYYTITIITSLILINSIVNLIYNQTLKPIKQLKINTLISILIPARNEEQNISKLLNSLVSQKNYNIEILVLDDNSSDGTYQVIYDFSSKYNNLKAIKGKPLPEGWLGKNWACHQLSEIAKGDILLFIDSDVILHQEAIPTLLANFYEFKLDALSVFPTQIMNSFGEKLVVPLMNWILLSMLPLFLVRKSKFQSFVAANGQLFLFSKEAYNKIGGHQSVRNNPVEDMELARNLKKNGLKIATFLGGELVKCNMYDGFLSSIQGFSKNFYKGFNINWLLFLLFVLLISIINLIPFFLVFSNVLNIIIIILIILNRIILSYLSKQNIFTNLLFHIPQFIVFLLIGIISVYKTKFGKNVWKGRPI